MNGKLWLFSFNGKRILPISNFIYYVFQILFYKSKDIYYFIHKIQNSF